MGKFVTYDRIFFHGVHSLLELGEQGVTIANFQLVNSERLNFLPGGLNPGAPETGDRDVAQFIRFIV